MIANHIDVFTAEEALKYLLPQKTRRAQRKALLWFLNFAHFCELCGRKILFLCG
jgi:hypothetical protein